MIRKDLIELINTYASLFVNQVKGQSAMGYNDLNIHAEQTSIPILNVVFGLELKNANQERKNYPAIDLIDEKERVAFQVTSTATSEKVISTLQKFIDNNLYEQYSTLYIYILTEKKSNYNKGKIKNIIKDKFIFDTGIHIIDYTDIMKRVNFIASDEVLAQLALVYKQLSTSLLSRLQSLQDDSKHSVRKSLSYTDRAISELEDLVGNKNIRNIPELPDLLQKISILENTLQEKDQELRKYTAFKDKYQEGESGRDLLTEVCIKLEHEYNDIKKDLEFEKEALSALSQNIRRQKEFLDQIDHQQASERMKEAGRLFEAGEYAMVNALLNYEGRQDYVSKKIEEKERHSAELKSMSNEEVLLALNMLQRQDWPSQIQQIKKHFEQSIKLGGYDINSLQYSYFLEEINEIEQAIDILYKALTYLREEELENRAAVGKRLGKLLSGNNKEKALNTYINALFIYEQLFEKDRNNYEFALADTLMECGTLYMQQSSLDLAREYLERALMIVGTLSKRADINMQKLTYIILMTLGSLHQQLGNYDQTSSYQKMALYMGAVITLDNPEKELFALLGAVKRFRMLMGEEKEGHHSEMIYQYAFHHFVRVQKWQTQDEAFNTAKALLKTGNYLLVEHEVDGASVCFQGALKIFKTLNKKEYFCLPELSNSLKAVGFIYMTKNNVKARKKVLLEALYLRKQLSVNDPVENLLEAASLLNELYDNSFIAVPPTQFYKATPFFDEALAIYKQLDEKYQQPSYHQWLQLLCHRGIFISRGLDKTNVIIWYQELMNVVNRIPSSSIELYEETIQTAIHEAGQVLLENASFDHVLYLRIAEDVITTRKILYARDPEKYNFYLLWALLEVGDKLVDVKQWKEACTYLQNAVEIIQELIRQEPDKYHKEFVMPSFKLAVGYNALGDHVRSANLLIDICNYFEARISEQSAYPDLLVSFMLTLTEVLLESEQKEKAADYIKRAIAYIPLVNGQSEQIRLKNSFEKLIAENFI
jgi:hypothetical protein